MRHTGLVAVVVAGIAFGATAARAQDPAKVAPNTYKVILENARVRVLDVTLKPGEKVPMHSHPANVVYPLNDSRARFTMPDGKTVDVDLKAGAVMWQDAQSHASENLGTTDARVLVIELKAPPQAPKK